MQIKWSVAFLFFSWSVTSQVILDNNIGDFVPGPSFFFSPANNWGRSFELKDFGVSQNEELTINSVEIAFTLGIYSSNPLFSVRFNVYEIDDEFPTSFPEANLLGSSQTVELNHLLSFGNGRLHNLTIDLDVPIVVSMNVRRILIEVEETVTRPSTIFPAYTQEEKDSSWFLPINNSIFFDYVSTDDYGFPGAHYYLKAYGEISTVVDHEILESINCENLSIDFQLTNTDNLVGVEWDFGDLGSGTNNSSIDFSPFHKFTTAGVYRVKAIITAVTGEKIELSKSIEVFELVRAYPIATIFSCEDSQGTGISSTFDTSNIESTVLGEQTGLEVSYFNAEGNPLPYPLPNPFQNTVSNSQMITVRVVNPNINCYATTQLQFNVVPIPKVNMPSELYACDEGDGFATFDTSSIEFQLTDGQMGLKIEYFDVSGNKLPNPFPSSYQNTIPYEETILVRVSNEKDFGCFSESSFKLIVNEPLNIDLLKNYNLCYPEKKLTLSVDATWDFWEWSNEEGTILSNYYTVDLSIRGNYSLLVGKMQNGILCKKMFSFSVGQSQTPQIDRVHVNTAALDNTVKVLTTEEGTLEYSIDGLHYQLSSLFLDVPGGHHTIHARYVDGCGTTTKDIFVLDYPRFFTPNNDGANDYWRIEGLETFSNATIQIFDRYGKLLKQLGPNDPGWDGTLNGQRLPSNDYWFTLNFQNGRTIKNHFTLKR